MSKTVARALSQLDNLLPKKRVTLTTSNKVLRKRFKEPVPSEAGNNTFALPLEVKTYCPGYKGRDATS